VTALGARFLSKPARPSELLAAIEQTIERSIDRR
jgi:FixJ family two-component response regulator